MPLVHHAQVLDSFEGSLGGALRLASSSFFSNMIPILSGAADLLGPRFQTGEALQVRAPCFDLNKSDNPDGS